MTPARFCALTASDRTFYIRQAKAALNDLRDLRLYGTGIYQERAGRRRAVMATLRLSARNRAVIRHGRVHVAWAEGRA